MSTRVRASGHAPPAEPPGQIRGNLPNVGGRNDSDLSDSSDEPAPRKVLPKFISVLGARGVGKTAVSLRVAKDVFGTDYVPTIEAEHKLDIEVDGVTHALTLLDTAGQSHTTSLNAAYLLGVDGFVLIFNVSSSLSFSIVKVVNEKLMYQKWADKGSGVSVIPRALVGNYLDVVGPNGEGRAVSYAEAKKYGDDQGIPYFECSALTGGSKCRAPFEEVVRVCHRNWMSRSGRQDEAVPRPVEDAGKTGANDGGSSSTAPVKESAPAPLADKKGPPVAPDRSGARPKDREHRAGDRDREKSRERKGEKNDGGNCSVQ